MKRLIVGISGASGVIPGIRLVEVLSLPDFEVRLIVSDAAKRTIEMETDWKIEDVEAMAHLVHNISDIGAPISSGSFGVMILSNTQSYLVQSMGFTPILPSSEKCKRYDQSSGWKSA